MSDNIQQTVISVLHDLEIDLVERLTRCYMFQRIVDLLNQAAIYGKDNLRVQHLRHVQELLLRKEPNLLDYFLQEVLTFQTDKSVEVKKTIISFIEEACQIKPEVLRKVIDNLHFLLYDDNIFVRKKLILSLISIYKSTLLWLAKSLSIEGVDRMWQMMSDMKNQIISQLNSSKDGLCLVVIKFIEMIVIIFTQYEQESFTINDHILSRNQLEHEGKTMIEKLIEFTLSEHLSNVHLRATVEALTNIIRHRSDCVNDVLQTFETLLTHSPSALTEPQLDNIRKIIQLKLCNLLRYSASSDSQSHIINFLTNFGITQTEILKYLPKTHPKSKRQFTSNTDQRSTKKFKNINIRVNNSTEKKVSSNNSHQAVTDLMEKLSIKTVVDLVLISMRSLPEKMPASFQSNYTPVRDAGGPTQIEYLARLLSAQLTADSYEIITSDQVMTKQDEERKSRTSQIDGERSVILWSATADIEKKVALTLKSEVSSASTDVKMIPCTQTRKRKSYKFSNVVQPIEYAEMQRLSMDLFHRILDAKDICDKAHVARIHDKIIRSLVSLSEKSFRDIFKAYLIDNIHERYDLAFAWIYQEYVHANGYLTVSEANQTKDLTKYDHLLCQLLEYLQENNHDLFSRLLISVPSITDNALIILERYCQNENCVDHGMKILRDLILHRIPIRDKCLDILLNFTQNEKNSIRNIAIAMARSLYDRNTFKQTIETYALKSLHISSMLKTDIDGGEKEEMSSSLYLSLLPLNHCLIQPFANLYTTVNEDVQQELLQILEEPVRGIGMNSTELLKLIRNCPKGAETLIIHIIHILTDQLPPSDKLVENITDLYHNHISDIRFLLPILPYLEKSEIKRTLPKLIQLSPSVVKDVFNQLLNLKARISPSELFIALHEIPLEECDLKIIINATTLCLSERSIYTDTILAEIIEHLVEITPIPLLFMRTVLQTLGLYPKMVSFVINILQRLITKQIWKQTRIWEGFIKCCEKTRPYSYPLLLQLPFLQLQQVFQRESTLHDGLRYHLRSISIVQRSSIPSSILEMIENDSEKKTFHPSS